MTEPTPDTKSFLATLLSGRKVIGPLGILSMILVFSAVVRVFASADAVIAATAKAPETPTEAVPAADHSAQLCTPDTDLQRVLDSLRSREGALVTRETETDVRIKELLALEKRIKAEQATLVTERQALEATMSLADTAAEDDLVQLTAVYERMKPKSAAAHFEAMNAEFAAGFLGRMKPATAAAIMAQMDPQFTYAISVFLAGRNANAGNVPRP